MIGLPDQSLKLSQFHDLQDDAVHLADKFLFQQHHFRVIHVLQSLWPTGRSLEPAIFHVLSEVSRLLEAGGRAMLIG